MLARRTVVHKGQTYVGVPATKVVVAFGVSAVDAKTYAAHAVGPKDDPELQAHTVLLPSALGGRLCLNAAGASRIVGGLPNARVGKVKAKFFDWVAKQGGPGPAKRLGAKGIFPYCADVMRLAQHDVQVV